MRVARVGHEVADMARLGATITLPLKEYRALVAENERLRGITKSAPYEVVQTLTAERDALTTQVRTLSAKDDRDAFAARAQVLREQRDAIVGEKVALLLRLEALQQDWRTRAERARPLESAPLTAEKRARIAEWMCYINRANELEQTLRGGASQ